MSATLYSKYKENGKQKENPGKSIEIGIGTILSATFPKKKNLYGKKHTFCH